MGYILPYTPIQSMNYASRMVKVPMGIPHVTKIEPVKPIHKGNTSFYKTVGYTPRRESADFDFLIHEFEGKGAIINETI